MLIDFQINAVQSVLKSSELYESNASTAQSQGATLREIFSVRAWGCLNDVTWHDCLSNLHGSVESVDIGVKQECFSQAFMF
jgi:2-keto-3-deoxy-galactonokinase